MSALENQPVSVGAGTNDLLERIWVRGVHWGAGIYVWGRLMLRSSMVTGNSVVGIENHGSATIAGSYIGANTAGGLMLAATRRSKTAQSPATPQGATAKAYSLWAVWSS